uniref:Uncharacterized protein n=1 Tax=Aegilops tauschii subsp. strangulata TaxID=200361 RepID=A0A453ML33_AEGTS
MFFFLKKIHENIFFQLGSLQLRVCSVICNCGRDASCAIAHGRPLCNWLDPHCLPVYYALAVVAHVVSSCCSMLRWHTCN